MKFILYNIAYNFIAMVFSVSGVILALKHINGWGWLIFCSIISAGSVTIQNRSKNKENDD